MAGPAETFDPGRTLMKLPFVSQRLAASTLILVAAALFAAWWLGLLPRSGGSAPANAMMVVAPKEIYVKAEAKR